MKKVKIVKENEEHQFSQYKIGDVYQISFEFDNMYIGCKEGHHACAISKSDCEEIIEKKIIIEPKKVIYLASPYSHPNPKIQEDRYEEIAKMVSKLTKQGLIVFSPIFTGHNMLKYEKMPGDWSFWQTYCISFLVKCDEMWIYGIDGWGDSKGIEAEKKIAKDNKIPIKFLSRFHYDGYVDNWETKKTENYLKDGYSDKKKSFSEWIKGGKKYEKG